MALTLDLPIERLKTAYPLGEWRDVDRLAAGKNEHFRVVTDQGRYVLRRSVGEKTPEGIRFEHELLTYLGRASFPAVPAVPTVEGAHYVSVDGRYYHLLAFTDGQPYEAGNFEQLRQVARALATYHHLVASFRPSGPESAVPALLEILQARCPDLPPPSATAWIVEEDRRVTGTVAGHVHSRSLEEWLDDAREICVRTIADLERLYPLLPQVTVHAGCRRDSVLFDADQLVAMLDYDSARTDARALDLAVALQDFSRLHGDTPDDDKVPLDLTVIARFMESYQEVTPLEPAEIEALPVLLMARRLRRGLGRYLRLHRREVPSPKDLGKVKKELARVRWLRDHDAELRAALSLVPAKPAQRFATVTAETGLAPPPVPPRSRSAPQGVVVTGGLGFIGSHVADAYLDAGHTVTIIDSTISSVVDGRDYDEHPRCTVLRQSVEEFFEEGGSFRGSDRVIHAAAHVGPAGILRYAGRLGPAIVNSTHYVLEACLEADVPVCVFSSAEVYGRSGQLAERDDIRVPTAYNARIEYAVAKTLTEAMVVNSRHRGLRGIIIRPFNVGGSRQSRAGGFVMPTFVQQALAGRPLTVFATGEQVRAFLAASDLSRFLLEFMDAALASGEHIYNIGNPANATTVRGLAHRVTALLGSDSPIVSVDATTVHGPLYVEAESFEKVPVLGAARALGWEPLADLDTLIMQTAAYYRAREDARGVSAPL